MRALLLALLLTGCSDVMVAVDCWNGNNVECREGGGQPVWVDRWEPTHYSYSDAGRRMMMLQMSQQLLSVSPTPYPSFQRPSTRTYCQNDLGNALGGFSCTTD